MAWLRDRGVAITGAGLNLEEARLPAIVERNGTRFGFLSYNCVGPKSTWASGDKSGCAYVNILTHYELDHATPGGIPTAYVGIELDSLEAMQDDIKKLRSRCDVLVVAFHKGLVHTPITVMNYERHLSYAAIDAGADLILGHHAHILHGIEQYKGKTIFHSLGNFVVSLHMTVDPKMGPEQWALRRKKLFGFEPDPEYPTYPFHPEAVHTIIAKCYIEDKKIVKVNYLPCLVNKKGQPEILKNDKRGQAIFDYVEKITNAAGLNAHFAWDGDEVNII
jgi:poly-gamma-glutamate capsule biosynthesis protein CapA/YwtB (metallophosphatase superfamily)